MDRRILFVGGYPNAIDINLYVFFRNLVHAIADKGVECHVVSPVSLTRYKANINKISRHHEEKTESGSIVHVHHPRYLSFSQKHLQASGGYAMMTMEHKLT